MSTPKTRLARMGAGFASNGVMQITQVFIRVAEVPVLLKLWGTVGYGEWLMLATLPAALSFGDGGFTKAAQREMTMRAARGDVDGIKCTFQTTWLLLLLVSATVMLFLSVALPKLSVGELLQITTSDTSEVSLTILMMSAQVFAYFQCSLLLGSFTSSGRYAIGVLLIALSSLFCFLGVVAGAALGKMSAAAFGSFLGQLIGYSIMLTMHIRTSKFPRYGVRYASLGEIRSLTTPSFANIAFPLTDALNAQGLRLVIGIVLGPVAVVIFSTTRTLCRSALQPVLSLARTLEPELSLAYGAGNEVEARTLFLQSNRVGFWLSITLCSFLIIFGPLIYAKWAGSHLDLNLGMTAMLLTAALLNGLWGIAITVPCSVNRHGKIAIWMFLSYGVGAVILAMALSRSSLGILGSALTILVVDCVMWLIALSFALHQLELSASEYFKASTYLSIDDVRRLWPRIRNRLERVATRFGDHRWRR